MRSSMEQWTTKIGRTANNMPLQAGLPSSHTTIRANHWRPHFRGSHSYSYKHFLSLSGQGKFLENDLLSIYHNHKKIVVNQLYLQSKARLVEYSPRWTGPIAQTPRGPTLQLPRIYLGNVVDIMSEVEQKGDVPDDPDVLHAMMGRLRYSWKSHMNL